MDDFQEHIDLLVDGELSEDERRELLLRLENEPNGWRTCALALLEAETFRDAFSNWMRDETTTNKTAIVAGEKIGPFSAFPDKLALAKRAFPVAAVAVASLLVGFAIGAFNGSDVAPGHSSVAEKNVNAPDVNAPISTPNDQVEPTEDSRVDDPTSEEREIPQTFEETPSHVVDLDSPWRLVSFYDDGSESDEPEFELPCREVDSWEDDWNDPSPSTLVSASLIESLRASGKDVRLVRRRLTIPASGGRTVVVPVEEIVVDYPSVDRFQ